MPSNHLIFCHPLLLLPSIFPSIRVSSNESVLCIRWPKYWSFSFSISAHLMNKGNIKIVEIIPECNPQNLLKCFLEVLKEPRESIKRLRKNSNFYLFIYWLQGGRVMKLKRIVYGFARQREAHQASALKTMEQSFLYGEIHWSTSRLLAI